MFARVFAVFLSLAALTAAALPGMAAPAAAQSRPTAKQNWTASVAVREDRTHVLGNPDAKLKIDEFVSYTCSHCATFQIQAEAPLRLAYVMPGTVSVRIVHFVRDPVDLTVTLLTQCGDTKGFFARHQMFLQGQSKWLAKARSTSEAQRARWSSGDVPARMRAIASDLDLYSLMARRGIGRAAVDRCLADTALASKLTAQRAEGERLGVSGTPSFAVGGTFLESVHDWASLKAAIDALL